MKKCTKCGIETNNFGPDKKNKDGLKSWCRDCNNRKLREYCKTKEGLVVNIYGNQRYNSKVRGHDLPGYTLQEFQIWIFSQDKFDELYINWKNSGYKKMLVPSIDRLDDYKGYSFDNIQLMTWEENNYKHYNDRKIGMNNKLSKSVIGTHIETGEEAEFYSLMEAERKTGISNQGISKCCRGKAKTAGGYVWEYL